MNIMTLLRRTDDAMEYDLTADDLAPEPDTRTTLEKFESGIENIYVANTAKKLRIENQISELTEELRQTDKCIEALDAARAVIDRKP